MWANNFYFRFWRTLTEPFVGVRRWRHSINYVASKGELRTIFLSQWFDKVFAVSTARFVSLIVIHKCNLNNLSFPKMYNMYMYIEQGVAEKVRSDSEVCNDNPIGT